MNNEILNEMKEKIKDADLVLVGVGELLAIPTRKMEHDEKFSRIINSNLDSDFYPYLQQVFIEENKQQYLDFYNRLFDLIDGKNYYVLTTNVDDVIYQSKIDSERIVAPCGSIYQFVCDTCKANIDTFEKKDCKKNQQAVEMAKTDGFVVKRCPVCNKIMQPNIVSYGYYDEKGYLDKWNRYTKWLQGTVNRKLCILELGVGLNYPTVIRWPNEKIVTYNNKSFMYRIHDKLYQLSEGIGVRAKSIEENPMNII